MFIFLIKALSWSLQLYVYNSSKIFIYAQEKSQSINHKLYIPRVFFTHPTYVLYVGFIHLNIWRVTHINQQVQTFWN